MTTAHASFDSDFLRQEIGRSENRARLRMPFFGGYLGRFVISWVAKKFLEKTTRSLRRDTMKYHGAIYEVAQLRKEAKYGTEAWECKDLVASVGRLQNSVQGLRKVLMGVPSKDAGLSSIAKACAEQASDLFEALESLRWELLELEASESPVGSGNVITSAEELAEEFRKIVAAAQ